MSVRVSPRLVAASYILELSSMELQQAVNQELLENPALEMVEKPTCSVCGGALQGSICPNCLSQQKGPDPVQDSDDYYLTEHAAGPNLAAPVDDDFDPLTQVAAQVTLAEQLLNDLQSILSRADLPIAEYLVGNLDDNGYLQCSVEEVADYLDVEIGRVEAVLRQLQSLEPIGVGARNLRECLLIQLAYLESEGVTCPYAVEIVSSYLKELGEHKYSKIASELGTSVQQVGKAHDFIKDRLNPYPAQGFSWSGAGSNRSNQSGVLPDVLITKTETGFEVEVVESKRFLLRVSPMYQRLSADLDAQPTRYSEEERRHIQHYVSRAKLFIANINQRRQTLHKITTYTVQVQKEFLEKGIRYLKPLTRASVAMALGMHESTVSRATASKFVMLPNGKVIPYSDFFQAALSVMDVIKEMIANEETPLTDHEISTKLADQGITVARRTVAKYREQLGILPSSLR